jgi:putative transposase
VTVADKRETVEGLVERKLSQRQACRYAELARSSFHYQPRPRPYNDWLSEQLRQQAKDYPSYGYRFQWSLLRRKGERVNLKRVHRLWKQAGLQLPRRRKKKRALGPQGEVQQKARFLNHVWSYDFLFDGLVGGQPLKVFGVLEEFTRQCLALVAARSIRSEAVVNILDHLVKLHGSPCHLRSDNGPEFVAEQVRKWLKEQRIETIFITPGSPWENPYIESFFDKLRGECLNREYFFSVTEANVILEEWRKEYNQFRPHSSLGYKTPAEVALLTRA